MEKQTKYLMAGSIIAGVGTVYAIQKNIDVDDLSTKIEKYSEMFLDVIEELVELSLELLEKIINFIKLWIKKLIFKFRMALSI